MARLYDKSPLLVGVFDEQDAMQYANAAWRETFGLTDQLPITWSNLMRHCHATGKGVNIRTNDFEAWLTSTRSRRGKMPFRTFEGDMCDGRWFNVTETMDEQGWMLCVAFDITTMRVGSRNLRLARDGALRAAQVDALTGVSNRRHVLQQLDTRLQELRQRQQPCGLVMLDLDNFKSINDTYGHSAGDTVLVHFARLVEATLRRGDGFGRIGGEEFMLLLPNITPEALTHAVSRVLELLRTAFPLLQAPQFHYTCSAGLAMLDSSQEPADNMRRADAALYKAKAAGRDRLEWG